MTDDALAKIREWDAKCGKNELVFFGTTLDRRRLLEYVDELLLQVAKLEGKLANIAELEKAQEPLLR